MVIVVLGRSVSVTSLCCALNKRPKDSLTCSTSTTHRYCSADVHVSYFERRSPSDVGICSEAGTITVRRLSFVYYVWRTASLLTKDGWWWRTNQERHTSLNFCCWRTHFIPLRPTITQQLGPHSRKSFCKRTYVSWKSQPIPVFDGLRQQSEG